MGLLPEDIVGQNIQELRETLDLNRREFAERLNYDPSKITRLERGEGVYDLKTIRLISESFNIPIESLISKLLLEDAGKENANE